MVQLEIATTEQKLLGFLQRAFPLEPRPYYRLGQMLGVTETQVIDHIQKLRDRGMVRSIEPVVDARRLGYQSTLVALKVPAERTRKAEQAIQAHPGISHGYERDHDFNVWVTLSVPPTSSIDAEVERLSANTGAITRLALPAVKLFKIGAYFDVDNTEQMPTAHNGKLPVKLELSNEDRRVINALQQDLPLTATPFDTIALEAGMSVDDLLAHSRSLLERGVIRRFSASINHRRAGFQANAMTCWAIPDERVDTIGKELAELREVSHCYERQTCAGWRHNLFAMIHSHSRDSCLELIQNVSQRLNLRDYVVLFSTREFKKTRIKYTA
ncbi:MAG: Lrp/AsnC family transcriptional regulator [Dehalococcoidia bacterium]|nr:Lrp/AsnC family transcriptional regulator [Dehalococcoidia bacterium]